MTRFTLITITLFLFILSILSVSGYTGSSKQSRQKDFQKSYDASCQVMIVFDGDTFGCDLDGDKKITNPYEHVRMLGIDTAEMHYSAKNRQGKDEPFAVEAKRFVEKIILNRQVILEFDTERYDKHNRLLAYVYQSSRHKEKNVMLNRILLKEGLAKTLFIGSNRRYEKDFKLVEKHAGLLNLKLWSLSL